MREKVFDLALIVQLKKKFEYLTLQTVISGITSGCISFRLTNIKNCTLDKEKVLLDKRHFNNK